MVAKMIKKKEYAKRIGEYINTMQNCTDDIPTLAGLAVYLQIDKKSLLDFENSKDKTLKNSFILAKNKIEHILLSRSALKQISSSTAHFYLSSAFDYKKVEKEDKNENTDYNISLFVEFVED